MCLNTNLACVIHTAAHDGILHRHFCPFLCVPAADKVLPLPSDVPAKPQAVMGGVPTENPPKI